MKISEQHNKRIYSETLLVLVTTIILCIVFKNYRSILTAFPVVYLTVERYLRKRTWNSIGFRIKSIKKDIIAVWKWLLIVIFVSPIVTMLIANIFLPEFITHVKERLPMDISSILLTLIVVIIGTFLEEVIFRAFVQERLSWFIGSAKAIIVASILFALMHYSSGDFNIVAFDMITIMIDSIIYGIIYMKTKNIFVSWAAHFLCDVVALCMIWSML